MHNPIRVWTESVGRFVLEVILERPQASVVRVPLRCLSLIFNLAIEARSLIRRK
jgi:hypothetical protein